MGTRTVAFLAILLMALALVPAGAHFFELPGKIGLMREPYFAVQQLYAGWALFGIILAAALVANVVLAVLLSGDRLAFSLALLAAAAVVVNLLIFFVWTYPANQATANWTRPTDDWEVLRRNWEYSHAVNALVTLIGFCSATLAALTASH
jgi:hypothetical protein